MASELRVNTLKDASGNNSVGLSTVAGGSAKAWVNLNGTGTIAARDSLNFSSHSDGGDGNYTSTYTSAMNNSNYCHSHHNVDDAPLQYGLSTSVSFSATTTSIQQRCGAWSGVSSANATSSDSERHSLIIMGDLA